MLLLCMALFFSCSSNDDDTFTGNESEETVTLLIAAPKSVTTRAVGDPGEAVTEGEDWNELAIIFAYTEKESGSGKPVIIKTLTKEDFEALRHYNDNKESPYRMYPISLERGKVHIYGITYSSGVKNSPKAAINACTTEDAVKALAISNNYAFGNVNSTEKFLSVATGYYMNNSQELAVFDISKKDDYQGELAPELPSMKLIRLAAKIDIQWDAQDAYDNSYTNVKAEGFTFYGDVNITTTPDSPTGSTGSGRLFPSLNTGESSLAGSVTFYNRLEISKRNGRVYHYVFPDGASSPKVVFNLTAMDKDKKNVGGDYTFVFKEKDGTTDMLLQQAAWYKVNTTIKGFTGNTTITVQSSK